jgi:hypothetical protein
LLCTGRQVINQFLIAQGVGDLGETTAHPADRSASGWAPQRTSFCTNGRLRRRLRRVQSWC